MSTKAIRLCAKRGSTMLFTLTVTDSEGDPVDLVDVTEVEFTARKTYKSTATPLALTVGAGITILAPTTDGQFTVRATPAEMDFAASEYVYDIRITNLFGAGDVLPMFGGVLEVQENAIP